MKVKFTANIPHTPPCCWRVLLLKIVKAGGLLAGVFFRTGEMKEYLD